MKNLSIKKPLTNNTNDKIEKQLKVLNYIGNLSG